MTHAKISIIIVHWNTPELLRKLLSELAMDKTIEIIVVDNASKDSVESITQDFSHVKIIQNRLNRGYAFACNQGATEAKGEWMLFLNPDVYITPEQVHGMIEEAHKKHLDACSPEPESSNYKKPLPTWQNLIAEFTPMGKIIASPPSQGGGDPKGGAVYTLTGGCLLIKSEVLKILGGWDERFFLWFEDSDLTKRLYDNNFRVGWITLPIKHKGAAAFEKLNDQLKRDIFFQSMEVYARKHFSSQGISTVQMIRKKYTQRNILPKFHEGVSLTIPNMKIAVLEDFFKANASTLTKLDEVIVVSSAITDENVWTWRKKYHQIRFIVLKHNNGFAATVNIGFRASTGAWFGTINDDTIFSKDWILECLQCNANNIGAINPVIYTQNNAVETAGIKIHPKGKAEPITSISGQDRAIVDALNGAAVVYKNEVLNKVGIFDERFGSYLEDIDLSLRIKRAGWNNIVCLKAKVVHKGHTTSLQTIWKQKPWLDFRNWIYVILKNWKLSDLITYSPAIILERLKNISGILKSI